MLLTNQFDKFLENKQASSFEIVGYMWQHLNIEF